MSFSYMYTFSLNDTAYYASRCVPSVIIRGEVGRCIEPSFTKAYEMLAEHWARPKNRLHHGVEPNLSREVGTRAAPRH